MVFGAGHDFLNGVKYYYSEGSNLKIGYLSSKWLGDDIHPHVNEMIGYKYSSYKSEIKNKFGSCSSNDE